MSKKTIIIRTTSLGVASIGFLSSMIVGARLTRLKVPEHILEEDKILFKKLKAIAEKSTKVNVTDKSQIGSHYNFSKDTISIEGEEGSSSRDAATLAHEMGHEMGSKGRGTKLSNLTHKLFKNRVHTATNILAMIYQLANPPKMNNKFTIKRIVPILLTLFNSFIVIGTEASATYSAYKLLKELGASDEYMKWTRKTLGMALWTYLGNEIGHNSLSVTLM